VSAVLALGALVGGALLGPVLTTLAEAIPAGRPVRSSRPSAPLAVTLTVVTATLWCLVALHVGMRWLLPANLWLAALAVVLVVTDVRHRRLPNPLLLVGGTGFAGLLVLAAVLDHRPGALVGGLVAAVALFALFLVAAVVSPAGMGMGDVKLVAVLGLALGYAGSAQVLLAIVLAFALHAVLAVSLLVTGRAGRRTDLPFGPALLIGSGLSLGWFEPLLAQLL
jgi:leader peptidase (prepilin peptidase)/N-methyltransferase